MAGRAVGKGAWRWPLVVTLVTLAGLGIRVSMAWAMRYPACNGDFSIISLMARHICQGTDFPLFAYGVAYMGSLEPALAALLAKLTGNDVTAFIVNLSPALIGTLLLPLLYGFGRDAGSRRAGLLAMVFCLVGSDTLLYNSVAPRGGYMNLMVCGVVVLWLAARIVTREKACTPVSWRIYAAMGLAAGVAWWVTQLALVFFLAAGGVLLAGFHLRILRRCLLAALPAFLLGSLPWWVWNLTHGWGSLGFGGSVAKVPLSEGVARFAGMSRRCLELEGGGAVPGLLRPLLFAGLVVLFVILFLHNRPLVRESERVPEEPFFYRLAILLLPLAMLGVYSTSSFSRINTTRYLLPLFPAAALCVGVGVDWIMRRVSVLPGVLLYLLVLPPHLLLLPRMFDGVPAARRQWSLAAQLEQQVAPCCASNLVGDLITTHWLNFASREVLCVASLPLERYAPLARRVELAGNRAYLNDFNSLAAFLSGTGASSRRVDVSDWSVDCDLAPPSDNWVYCEDHDIAGIRDHQGAECKASLMDANLDTVWTGILHPASTACLTVRFTSARAVCGLRWHSVDDHYPWKVSVEGRGDDRAPWKPLLPPTGLTTYFWSRGHAMIDGMQYYQECRFTPPPGGVRELRLVMHAPPEAEERVQVGELLVLEQAAAAAGSQGGGGTVGSCAEALAHAGVRRFLAPRWLAEQIMTGATNALSTQLPSLFQRSIQDMAEPDPRNAMALSFPERTGLLMDPRDVPHSRLALSAAGKRWTERSLGEIVLLVVEADERPEGQVLVPLYWTEQGCFGAYFAKERAHEFYRQALGVPAGDGERIVLLQQATGLYPHHQAALALLVAELERAGREGEAARIRAQLDLQLHPAVPARVAFRNGVELQGIGITGGAARVTGGRSLRISYYWKCPAGCDPTQWAVFVHCKSGAVKFQDDHVLLAKEIPKDLRYQPFEECFREEREVVVPQDIPAGTYEMWLGLVARDTGRRLSARTDLPTRRQAVLMPLSVTLAPPPAR